MDQDLLDYFRIPTEVFTGISATGGFQSGDNGFFQLGSNNICYGRCRGGVAASVGESGAYDVSKDIYHDGKAIQLPFSFAEVIENLRLERYRQKMVAGKEAFAESKPVHNLYYLLRGCLPFSVRRRLQRAYFSGWKRLQFPAWPVDFTVDTLHEEYLRLLMEAQGLKRVPFVWFWPERASSCLIITHDVETSAGRDFTSQLLDLDDGFGFKASIQAIPEKRYEVPDAYVREIQSRGFEFNIHDLNHDGCLYVDRAEFLRRAAKINGFIHRYNSRGFRAGSLYRNLDWYDAFEFSYDMSVPNVAHLEAMRGGCCTVMPFFVGKIIELPVTTAQDYSLFHILNEYSIGLWKQQTALIRERNGLISVLTHPDYLIERRARNVYETLLDYLREAVARENIWTALPGDVDLWWRARSQMKLVSRGNEWEIEGPGKERARLAYATLHGGRLVYEFAEASSTEKVVP